MTVSNQTNKIYKNFLGYAKTIFVFAGVDVAPPNKGSLDQMTGKRFSSGYLIDNNKPNLCFYYSMQNK